MSIRPTFKAGSALVAVAFACASHTAFAQDSAEAGAS